MELSPAEHVPYEGKYREMDIAYFSKFKDKKDENSVQENIILYGTYGKWVCRFPLVKIS